MFRNSLETNAGLVRFHSKDAVTAYLESLLEYYRTRHEEYGQQLAEHLRMSQEPAKASQKPDKQDKKGGPQTTAKGWTKIGDLPVNVSDPGGALAQVTLRIVEDYKAKVDKITGILKSFNDIDTVSQGTGDNYTLFIIRGVPEAVIVQAASKKIEVFNFTASFRAV